MRSMPVTLQQELEWLGQCFHDLVIVQGINASLIMDEQGLSIEIDKQDMEDPEQAGKLIASMMFKKELKLQHRAPAPWSRKDSSKRYYRIVVWK